MGSSVDASDWAGGILRRMVRSEVEKELPEFKAAVDVVREDSRTVVQVVIYPVGQLVQDINYSMESQSIPNLLLLDLKQRYAQKAEALRGLPVDFVKKHQMELENLLLTDLKNEKSVQRHNLEPSVKLVPASTLGVEIGMGSDKYKIWFEATAISAAMTTIFPGVRISVNLFPSRTKFLAKQALRLTKWTGIFPQAMRATGARQR